jgi:hypothetical protein
MPHIFSGGEALGVRKPALPLTRILHLASGFGPNGHGRKATMQTQMPGTTGRAERSPTGDLGLRFAGSAGVSPNAASFLLLRRRRLGVLQLAAAFRRD